MIEEGITNIEIIEKKDHTLVLQKFSDETVEIKIPKLNMRNQIAVEIWRLQQSINQMTVIEAMQAVGLRLPKVEFIMLCKKLVAINDHIKSFNSQPKPRAGFISGVNP